ncbi:MAG: phosphoribosylformylglycinamidine synthase subunit PurQ [Rhodospirillaceae bacterium]|nr:MAG: phosphoribosylformylglycinamidine synthase subunit PurQ [Rhodospirillaceae bacterium]
MKAAVIVFPGSNCDRDIAVALEQSIGRPPVMVWHRDTELPDLDLIVVPGGFSYGDYLRCGAMAAHSPVMREVKRRAEKGARVLGICNGFQIITEAGLLPGVLMRNRDLKYVCKDVHLKVGDSQSAFTTKYKVGEVLRIPIGHGDGNYFADTKTLDQLDGDGLVAFRYCTPKGAITDDANPNGSQRNIAGIFNSARTVLGMMPHPERLADITLGGTDGRAMFESLVETLS